MRDLNALMHSMEADVTAHVSGRTEFRATPVRRAIRRRRTARAVAVGGLAVLVVGGIAGAAFAVGSRLTAPAAAPSPSTTPSATASVTPTVAATGESDAATVCPSRAVSMDAATARTVASRPRTGETWLDSPQPITPPAGDAATSWFLFGHRGDREIIGYESGLSSYTLAERSPDGAVEWIARPMPTSVLSTSLQDAVGSLPYPVNSDQCYESLALPDQLEITDDISVPRPEAFQGSTSFSGVETEVAAFGGNRLVRIDNATDMEFAATVMPTPSSAVTYAVRFASGDVVQVAFDPLAGGGEALGVSLVDYFDQACGVWRGPSLWDGASSDTDWVVVDSVRGHDLAVPTTSNPYAQERYAAYSQAMSAIGTTPITYEQFVSENGIAGIRSDDGGWWVGLNAAYSPRAWC